MRCDTRRHWPVAGSHSSALSRSKPPTTSTRPSAKRNIAWRWRERTRSPARVTVPRCASISSAKGQVLVAAWPPATRMRPSASVTTPIDARPVAKLARGVICPVAGSMRSTDHDRVERPREPPITSTAPSGAMAVPWNDTARPPPKVRQRPGPTGPLSGGAVPSSPPPPQAVSTAPKPSAVSQSRRFIMSCSCGENCDGSTLEIAA
jgi:hypothetical protein